ncbi:hypothetical protein ACFQ3N_19155 [Virgibacillus byunsanensis]|uniref:Sporulation protein n=1 Tax=Virgibacillus byunsanensis TaxID=570945 RepID=A0ABW3LT22_9BACI
MKKWMVLILLSFILFGCTQAEEAEEQETDVSDEPPVTIKNINPEVEGIVAQVDGHEILGKNIQYEMKRLELISVLQGDENEEEASSPNVALQEIIRNHMIHKIARDENITVDESEQQKRVEDVRQGVESNDGYARVMKGIDEEQFWSREEERYEQIVEAEKLIVKLMENVKKEHPNYDEKALRFDAQEDLDELIQQEVVDATIEIYEEEG